MCIICILIFTVLEFKTNFKNTCSFENGNKPIACQHNIFKMKNVFSKTKNNFEEWHCFILLKISLMST